jgi:hypothetical protein
MEWGQSKITSYSESSLSAVAIVWWASSILSPILTKVRTSNVPTRCIYCCTCMYAHLHCSFYCLLTYTSIFTRTSLKPPPLLKIVQVPSGLFDVYSSTYTYFYSSIFPHPYSFILFLFFTHTFLFFRHSQTNGQKGTNIMNMVISFYNNGMDGTYSKITIYPHTPMICSVLSHIFLTIHPPISTICS